MAKRVYECYTNARGEATLATKLTHTTKRAYERVANARDEVMLGREC